MSRVRPAPPPDCLEIMSTSSCAGPVSSIDENKISNDPRVLRAGVSQEEARIYIREVNAHLAKSISPKKEYVLVGLVTCVTWAIISVAFIMNAVLYKEPRLRCDARDGVCRGRDPLVDNCCVFWCCGKEMAGRNRRVAADRELPARPYDRWDVWANRTHFNNTAGCSINDKKFDGEKNDRDYDCLNCPLTRKRKKCDGNGNCKKVNRACKTMYEGKASHYAVEWPRLELLFLASVLLVSCMLSAFGTLYHRMYREVYDEAFAEWRRRGIVTRVEFVPAERAGYRDGEHPAYLRLFFPITMADGTTGSNVVTTPSSPSMFTAEPLVPVATIAPSTFTVQVPPDGSAGQVMQLQAPNGVTLQVQIPFGCAAGSTFEVAMPARA